MTPCNRLSGTSPPTRGSGLHAHATARRRTCRWSASSANAARSRLVFFPLRTAHRHSSLPTDPGVHVTAQGPDQAGGRWLPDWPACATPPGLGKRGVGAVGVQQSYRASVAAVMTRLPDRLFGVPVMATVSEAARHRPCAVMRCRRARHRTRWVSGSSDRRTPTPTTSART